MRLAESKSAAAVEEEDRVLRVWTPIILRVSVLASALILVAGLVAVGLVSPASYIDRFHEIQKSGRAMVEQSWSMLAREVIEGRPHAVLTFGLLLLTLVPLGRVGFTFLFFLKQRDVPFTVLTAIVLLLLVAGIVLGRVG